MQLQQEVHQLHACDACRDRRFYDCTTRCNANDCDERCELGPRSFD